MKDKYRIGVDIGGTFTDFTVVDDETGEVLVEKCLTTPDEPEQAVQAGLRMLASQRNDVLTHAGSFIHATTLLTNVVLERKGARTGLITTAGFRDILEFARELRYDIYDPFIAFSRPLVERPLRVGVRERTLVNGSVYTALDEQDVRGAAQLFRESEVESVAICFLHSYKNDAHERRARDIVQELLPGVQVSISSEVLPEPKEYERISTTVLDAYVKPTAAVYLDKLGAQLRKEGYTHNLFVMMSNGGSATAETTKQFPVQAIESGPAAGVEAASHYGKLIGASSLLSFDMGGTTAKLCIVLDGKAQRTRSFEVDRVQRFKPGSGIPIAVPVYDLLEIGAGGGSIARVNELGLLAVGPDSAGSKPGPACYGLGGKQPTVTDADLILGYLGEKSFLGGSIPLSLPAARSAMDDSVARRLGMSAEQAAWGIHNLVNETMASAARVHIAEKGQSAKDLALVGFGGAGPVHAVGLARKLGCPRVVIPPLPGVMSAFGLLTAPVAFERSRAVRRLLEQLTLDELATLYGELGREAAQLLPPDAKPTMQYSADIWRRGQDYALEIEVDPDWLRQGLKEKLAQRFDEQYALHYGRVDDETALEIVTVRAKATRTTSKPSVSVPATGGDAVKGRRAIYVPARETYQEVPVYDRSLLAAGTQIDGPAIVEERESTTVLDHGDQLTVDPYGCLVINLAYPNSAEH